MERDFNELFKIIGLVLYIFLIISRMTFDKKLSIYTFSRFFFQHYLNRMSARISIRIVSKVDFYISKLPLSEKWPYSSPYFPAFELNTDQKNFAYGHFVHSVPMLFSHK